jgi:hypothetical protein
MNETIPSTIPPGGCIYCGQPLSTGDGEFSHLGCRPQPQAPNDGGPAFPLPAVFSPECGTLPGQGGMSLRDWFAGMALANLTQAPGIQRMQAAAEFAYKQADAMLEARGKVNK